MFCLLILMLVTACYPCSSNCWFALDNRTGSYDSANLWDKTVAGIPQQAVITVNGTFSLDRCQEGKGYEFLKFIAWDDESKNIFKSWRVLVVKMEQGRWTLHGDKDSSTVVGSISFDQDWQQADGLMTFQLSSATSTSYYDIWLNNKSTRYDYHKNWSFWQDHRLNSVNSIHADCNCAQYQYIMVCNDSTPRLCDTDLPDQLVLGQDYTINCTGSGSPVMGVEWSVSYDNQPSTTPIRPNVQTTTNTPRPDIISSTLTVANFSVHDIATYTCSIYNQRYGTASTINKTFTLAYFLPLTSTPPSSTVYSATETPLIWSLSGWPLAHTSLSCSYNHTVITLTVQLQYTPPSETFLIPTTYPEISCTLSNSTHTISTLHFTRIGYNCAVGYYGWVNGSDLLCELCPTGTTALVHSEGSSSCQALRSSCISGQYGADCLTCPGNMTSLPGSVKLEECYREGGERVWFVYGVLAGGGTVGLVSMLVIVWLCKRRKGVEWHYPNGKVAMEVAVEIEEINVDMETVDLKSTEE